MTKTTPTNAAVACAFALLLALDAANALDLTPQTGFRRGNEGPPTPVTQFTDGKNKVTWLPPAGWDAAGGPNSASMTSPDGSAWMKLVILKKDNSQPEAAPPAPEDLKALTAQFIPAGAKNLTFVKTVPSPFMLGGRASTEFIFTFDRYGSHDSISISFVEYSDTERLVAIVSSDEKSFEKIHALAMSSLFTWQVTKTGP